MPRSCYVHVPFCVHRCGYCDFTVLAGRDDLAGRYVEALARELDALPPGRPPLRTLFIGGGTPTQLPPEELDALLRRLRAAFDLEPDAEVSVEANPHGLTDAKLGVLREHGVNRVSLGVQALDGGTLRLLERDHAPGEALERLAACVAAFPSVSADLIFGVPGLSDVDWRRSLMAVAERGVQHVSTYGLTFERGTAFWTRRRKGQLAEMPDERQRTQYAEAMDRLTALGFEHYELSNFARPGHRSRHNGNYWDRGEYWGLGPGAASLVGGVRRTNHRSTTTWLKRVEAGGSGVAEEEPETPGSVGEELVMLGLRRAEGLSEAEFEARAGTPLRDFCPGAVEACVRDGWLAADAGRVRLTREGRFLADTVVGRFFEARG